MTASRLATYRFATVLIAAMIVCGVLLRGFGLNEKLFTNDEATTQVHVSGHTIAQFFEAAYSGKLTNARKIMRFQTVDPATNLTDVVSSLAIEDPQHPPLFYVLQRFWMQMFGDSITARRSLPALFGVAAIFAAFQFGRQLTASIVFASVLAALVAASPFHLVYSQNAREYSLWTLLIFTSSWLLLRAVQVRQTRNWALYGLSVALGLYTDLLFIYVIVSHVVYIVMLQRRTLKHVIPFAITTGLAVIAFAPWLSTLFEGRGQVTNNSYLGSPLPVKLFVLKWLFNVGSVFYDLDYVWHISAIVIVALLALVTGGIVLSVRKSERRVWLFAVTLTAATALAFLIPDFLRHESRSTSSRYLIPTWIGCEMFAALAIAWMLKSASRRLHIVGNATLFALALLGFSSGWVSVHHQYWWSDASIAPIGPISVLVRQAGHPVTVIFSDDHPAWDFSPVELANEVASDVNFVFVKKHESLNEASGSVFALDPSDTFRQSLAYQGWRADLVYREETQDAGLRELRAEASRARSAAGYVENRPSLWRLTKQDRREVKVRS